ncbi:unnamed protein product [Phaedon cochleariae]|uniref:Protein kinase domain-containing protein n=1 Tax=Phaedon cochleariae TaxID=80249 RepID=A0A9N9SAL4_PHACE|nr:unnamed protein product [Phaedon cochleariae]
MKKIGEHDNIVKLLGCVTMDQPYMLIMELVPCGSLKKYLCRLREKWIKMKTDRFFFPDNNVGQDPSQALKYTSVIFENSNSDSYIVPDNICMDVNREGQQLKRPSPTSLKPLTFANDRKRYFSEGSQMPQSPMSLTSSQFPSCTNTDITVLDTPSPLLNEMNDLLHAILDHKELQNFAYQIANGMRYLESIQITHRDLAARNVLMSANRTLKISDFGLSRTGVYVSSAGARLPLRWMALEAIEARTCDPKTDVWSFGVVLWEIGTLGVLPYKNLDDCQILPFLRAGKRLDRPGICTDDLYSLMLRCWREDPEERPFFADLVDLLDVKKRNMYVDLREVSPEYVFSSTTMSEDDTEDK